MSHLQVTYDGTNFDQFKEAFGPLCYKLEAFTYPDGAKGIKWGLNGNYNVSKTDVAPVTIEYIMCSKCGNAATFDYIEPTKTEMLERQLCFKCNFWREKVLIKDKPNVARIEGRHYMIEPDSPKSHFQGFGGCPFTIQFNDGRTVQTRNLWHQGDIPEHYKAQLPDNAVFVKEARP